MIIHRNDSIAHFYEGFINYGFNKISYIEALRLDGYRFVIGGNFFAFDLPHYPFVHVSLLNHRSRFQKQHANGKTSLSYMTNYYYMRKIKKRSLGKTVLHPICPQGIRVIGSVSSNGTKNVCNVCWSYEKEISEAGNRTPVVRVTGGNTKPLYYFGSSIKLS